MGQTELWQEIPFRDIVAQANDIVIVTEAEPTRAPGPRIVYVNEAFTKLTGYSTDEVMGKTPRILQGKLTDKETRQRIRRALDAGQPHRDRILNYSKTGRPYWLDINIVPLEDSSGTIRYFVAIERDVTETVLQERQLLDESLHDPLTGIYNRRGFFRDGEFLVSVARLQDKPVSLAMIDIDHFKKINDTHGHGIGDRALQALSQAMQGSFRTSDIIARIGGEEFAVLLAGTGLDRSARKLESLRKLVEQLLIPVLTGNNISITISIGLAELDHGDEKLEQLMTRADKALYSAKHGGRNRVVVEG